MSGEDDHDVKSSRKFYHWLQKCESAMQTRPTLRIEQILRANDRILLHSIMETKSESKYDSKPTDWKWGWFKTRHKDDQPNAPSSFTKESNFVSFSQNQSNSLGKGGVFDDLLANLNPITESESDKSLRERSERYLDKLIRYSPMIRFMLKHLSIVGCSPLDENGFVEKIFFGRCHIDISGGFMPSQSNEPKSRSGLLICYNGIKDKSHLERTLAHEMIHWFDHCRFKTDWSNLRHIACSEVRAASLSGDCRLMSEMQRGKFGVRKHHQTCAKRRAIVSLSKNPSCPDEKTAERIVEEIFESCFADTRPFDEIY